MVCGGAMLDVPRHAGVRVYIANAENSAPRGFKEGAKLNVAAPRCQRGRVLRNPRDSGLSGGCPSRQPGTRRFRPFGVTTSSGPIVDESISTASSARRSGAAARLESRSSRARISALVSARSAGRPPARSSATRRRARSSAVAVRKNLASASGKTTVPMSRPSTTTPPGAPIRRCRSSRAARTSGSAETREAPSEISGVRIEPVTSSPFAMTRLTCAVQPER